MEKDIWNLATSPRAQSLPMSGTDKGPEPVFVLPGLGVDASLLMRLLDHHPGVRAAEDSPDLKLGPEDSMREAVDSLIASASRDASMSLRHRGEGRPASVPLRWVCTRFGAGPRSRLDSLLKAFPSARVLALIRDGRDVIVEQRLASLRASSYDGLSPEARAHAVAAAAFHSAGPGAVSRARVPVNLFCPVSLRVHTNRWIESLRPVHLAAELAGDRAKVIRADDFVAETFRAHASVCVWLGLAGDAADILGAVESARGQVGAATRRGVWREVLSEADIAAFKRMAGELLVELGYEQGTGW